MAELETQNIYYSVIGAAMRARIPKLKSLVVGIYLELEKRLLQRRKSNV